jgi:hypothetical protein
MTAGDRLLLASALGAAAALGCGSRTGLEVALDAEVTEAAAPEAAPDATPVGCGPLTCAGCCDDAGACQPGSAKAACGAGGYACQACTSPIDVCDPSGDPNVVGRVCWALCDIRSCGGCCTPAGCFAGDADDACGGPLNVCTNCTALGMTCQQVGRTHACVMP